jgi:CheY-like chemotaxis protein
MALSERFKVVVVDDERAIADKFCEKLRALGYEAYSAYDGESALMLCRSQQPGAVISDLCMPGINGLELAVIIKEQLPGCKVVLLSHSSSMPLIDQARQSGCDFDLLDKTIQAGELAATIGAL